MTKYRKNEAFIRNDGAHEGRAQCAKQAVVSPMNKGVLQALRRSRTTIANCGVHVISGIFCRANACVCDKNAFPSRSLAVGGPKG